MMVDGATSNLKTVASNDLLLRFASLRFNRIVVVPHSSISEKVRRFQFLFFDLEVSFFQSMCVSASASASTKENEIPI